MMYYEHDTNARKILLLDYVEAHKGSFINIGNTVLRSDYVLKKVEVFFYCAFKKNTYVPPKWMYSTQLLNGKMKYEQLDPNQRKIFFEALMGFAQNVSSNKMTQKDFLLVEEFFKEIYSSNPQMPKTRTYSNA